ncbi:MAG: GumC family protein [Gemmatimonadaceae bacterium]
MPPVQPRRGENPPGENVPWARYLGALLRHKWLIALLTLAGAGAGFLGTRFIDPEYQAVGTVWISDGPQGPDRGPIRAAEILSIRAWPELLRSFAVLDRVVQQERLFLTPSNAPDTGIFLGFTLADQVRPGGYELIVAGTRYSLLTDGGALADSGAVGDSIGRRLGFLWAPTEESLDSSRSIPFHVTTIRGASIDLRAHIDISGSDRTNLLNVTLRGSEPATAARTLNTLLAEFVHTAAQLKKQSLVENAAILREQLDYASRELQAAEIEYETFRVSTITLPSEGTALASGVELTRDPVFSSFFEQRIDLDRTQRDLAALQRLVASAMTSGGDLNAAWGIPSVQTYGAELRTALNDYTAKEAALRSMRTVYTDEHPSVREARDVLRALRTEVVLPLMRALVLQLRERENDLTQRLAGTSRELQQIPSRTIEEQRLKRNVAVRENLYTILKNRYEEARLAEASSLADVSILDGAAPPQLPSSNTAPRLILVCTAAGLGLAILLTLLLDRIDPRLRYPEQVTREMGLNILGAIPTLSTRRSASLNIQEASQVVEAFRSIRLSLFHALGGRHPLHFAVSSPGVGDGKSLVSANLALSFAEMGYSTLVVDGDLRRGTLHSMFGAERRPGLCDLLAGETTLASVLQPTQHGNLTILASGTRSRRAPELLMASGLTRLMATLRNRFHVIIIDTPPLGASIDPFALGSVAENMVLVVRSGETDRKMAQAKLEVVDRLPIRVVGAILNDVRPTGAYKYYSYLDGYAVEDELAAVHAGDEPGTVGVTHGL